jgi:4'-phosphopantetheinyl transferase EntD
VTSEGLLRDRIAALFDAPVAVVHGAPAIVAGDLFPEEREHVRRAVPKRQAEFGTARVCARIALAELGYAAQALHPWPDRSPRWPEGAVGTITHCDDFCAVVVARAGEARGLGLDAEPDAPLEAALVPLICTPRELAWLDTRPPADRGHLAKIVFCAKEAFYKCQYPTTRAYLDFLDVAIDLQPGPRRFSVRIVGREVPHARLAEDARGRFDVADGRVLAGATL